MKVLLLGTTGMIGHRIWIELSKLEHVDLYGLSRTRLPEALRRLAKNPAHVKENVDVSDFLELEENLNKLRPDFIINATGITIRKISELKSIEKVFELNSLLPRKLLLWAQSNNSRVIQLSTDCVFSGKQGHYSEESIPDAEDIYGKSKFLGELYSSHALTLRFSAIGREIYSRTELLEWFLSNQGKSIEGFSKVYYSGVTNIVLAKEVARILRSHSTLSGLYQISSDPISKYDLLEKVNKAYTRQVNIVKDSSKISDKTMDNRLYKEATGYLPPTWDEMIEELVSETLEVYKN